MRRKKKKNKGTKEQEGNDIKKEKSEVNVRFFFLTFKFVSYKLILLKNSQNG
jgi:hypothetical protein